MTMTDEQGVAAEVPFRRRKSRAPLLVTIAMIVVVGVSVGWLAAKYLTAHVNDVEVAELPLPRFGDDSPVDKGNAGQTDTIPDTGTSDAATSPATPESQPRKRNVSSYEPGLAYPVTVWSPGKAPSGFIDSVSVNGVAYDPKTGRPPLTGIDVLELSGWTGDVSIGVRYPFVMISACGRVIAHTAVNRPRPDVAKKVHENLGQSGWHVSIAATHLPVCENRSLAAWGVAPGNRKLILPVNGTIPMDGDAVGSDDSVAFVTPGSALKPEDLAPLPAEKLKVVAEVLNMRRCGRADCPVTGKLARGIWDLIALDESEEWLLVALPDRAGWVSKRFVEIVQRPR